MKSMTRRIFVGLALLACGGWAFAQGSLADAKANGLIGERADGLVALVTDNPSSALRTLVAEVNAERMSEYNQIAAETDAPLAAVQARAGRQIIDRLPAGQYFMDAAGRWRQK